MEAPTEIDRCLAILVLRRAGCSQDAVTSIMHCAKSTVGEVENWFSKRLSYAEAVELCRKTAINQMINFELANNEEVGKKLLQKVMGITPDIIFRQYRQGQPLPVKRQETDVAVHLRNSIANVSAKDWSIWGFPDMGKPPMTSEAGLKIWMDRGKPVVELAIEQDKRFPLFMARLKSTFPEFSSYDAWRKALAGFILLCRTVAQEICSRAVSETGLMLISVPVMGQGHLLNVPQFVYEFALDNHAAAAMQPNLQIIQIDPYRYKLVPDNLPDYILAIGSKDEMERCQKVTISLAQHYTRDDRIAKIISEAKRIKEQSAPFLLVLATVIA